MKKLNIAFTVFHKNNGKMAKVKTLTIVRIYVDNTKVAEATLAGKYTIDQAIQEFKRNPIKFHNGNSVYDKDQLAELSLIA